MNSAKITIGLRNRPWYVYNYYVCDYCPLPSARELNIKFKSRRRNPGFKMKVFNNSNSTEEVSGTVNFKCIRTVIENLYNDGYTHIVNMRGSFSYICKIARLYRITVCDHRLRNYVAKRFYDISTTTI